MKKRMWGQSLKTYDLEQGQIVFKKNSKSFFQQPTRKNLLLILLCAIIVVLYLSFSLNTKVKLSHHHLPNLTAVLPTSLSLPLSDRDLLHLNGALALLPVPAVLFWVSQVFSEHVAQVTSFGLSGMVVLEHLDQLGLLPQVPVISVDTLHLFPETYLLIGQVRKQFPTMKFNMLTPIGFYERITFDEHYGSDIWKTDPARYGFLTKTEPLQKSLEFMNITLWITGRRRSQGGERAHLQILEQDLSDPAGTRLKLNPLAFWTKEQVWDYIRSNNIPYNALHDKGYASIGDVMNTRPIIEGEREREGRFVGQNNSECGMHSHLAKVEKLKKIATEKDEKFEMPHLPCDDCTEVTKANFQSVVLEGKVDAPLLIEFYSPMCSFCQAFAPKFAKAAEVLKTSSSVLAARMDITMEKIPPAGEQAGFAMTGFPTLYLVQYAPDAPPALLKYEGAKETDDLVAWVRKALSVS